MRSLQHAEIILGDIDVKCLQAPNNQHNTSDRKDPMYSYAHILHKVIFHSPKLITETLMSWQNIFKKIKPELLIAEHSPGALFASREQAIKTVQIGTGFTVPPNNVACMPNLRDWMPKAEASIKRVADIWERVELSFPVEQVLEAW